MSTNGRDRKELGIPKDGATYTDVHKAVMKNNVKKLKMYLDRGPGPWGHVDSQDWWGRTSLHRAVEKNYISCVKEILIQGGNVNLREKWWSRTPLHIACEKGHAECVQHLIAYGADVNMWAKEGWTPLILAVYNGQIDCVKLLLKAKANLFLRTSNDYQALHYASKQNYDEIAQLLIAHGANPSSRVVDKGPTPLHVAAEANAGGVVSVLLGNGADTNARDLKGMAPLHNAVQGGCLQATHALISHYTCDLHIKNNEDQDPLDVCIQKFRNSSSTKAMQQTLAYVRKAYSDEVAKTKPQIDTKADYSFLESDSPNAGTDMADVKSNASATEQLTQFQSQLKTLATKMRDLVAVETRRRKVTEAKQKSKSALIIEDAMRVTLDAYRACNAANRAAEAAMLTALATDAGDYDEEEFEALRKDLGEKKRERWENEWKADETLYYEALALYIENLDLKLNGQADGLSAPLWTNRFAKIWTRLQEYHWSSRPGSERETLNKGEDVVVQLRKNETFFKATISNRYNDGTYLVTFRTGDKKHVRRDQIQLGDKEKEKNKKSSLKFGDGVIVHLKGWEKPYEGYIVRINTDGTYDVKFMDGSKEQYLEREQMRKKPHPIPYYYFLPGALVSSGKEFENYFTREEHVLEYIVYHSSHFKEAVNNSRRREVKIEELESLMRERDAEISRLQETIQTRNHDLKVATEVERLLTPSQNRSKKYRAVRRVFSLLDVDNDGELSSGEILSGLMHNKAVIALVNKVPELRPLASPEIYRDAFETMDADGDGSVSLEEFLEFRQKLDDTLSLFKAIDKNGDGYLSKSELLHGLKRPEVKKLLYRQPELKEFTNSSTFETAWFELHVKKPSFGVSMGELLCFARKVGVARRIFELMPRDEKGRILKRDFLHRVTMDDVRLLLLKEQDLSSLANPDEVEVALWDVNEGNHIALDELIRFSRKTAGLRAVFDRLGPVDGRIIRQKFMDTLQEKKGNDVIFLLKTHPDLAGLLDGSYRESFLVSANPNHLNTASFSEVLIFTRKLGLLRSVMDSILQLEQGKTQHGAEVKNNLQDFSTRVGVHAFIKAVSSRNKIRRLLQQEHSLKLLLNPRAIKKLLIMVSDAEDQTLDADKLMTLSHQILVCVKIFESIDPSNNGSLSLHDIKAFYGESETNKQMFLQVPLFADLDCFLHDQMSFKPFDVGIKGMISVEEFILGAKRSHILSNALDDGNGRESGALDDQPMVSQFRVGLSMSPLSPAFLVLQLSQDSYLLDFLKNLELCEKSMEAHTAYAGVYESPNPTFNTFNKALDDIATIGLCLNYVTNTLFPMVAKQGKGNCSGDRIPSTEFLKVLKHDNQVRENLTIAAPKGVLQYMIETEEFRTDFLEMSDTYSPDLFYSFAIKYCAERFEYNKMAVSLFYKASHSSTAKNRFDDMLRKGSNSLQIPGEFTTRTILREIENLRVKGNKDLNALQKFIDTEKKKIRRLLNRVFCRVNTVEKEFNLLSRDDFFVWVRPPKEKKASGTTPNDDEENDRNISSLSQNELA